MASSFFLRRWPSSMTWLVAAMLDSVVFPWRRGSPLSYGVISTARCVKWLDSINIIGEECQGFFMQRDYKMFPSSVNWENIDWSTRKPQMDFPVQNVICSLEDDNTVQHRKVKVHGYAVSRGGRGIERLDVSFDGGKAWVEASRHQKSGISYNAIAEDDIYCDKWAWVLFEAKG